MDKIKSISVVIPAYNEEAIIKESIISLHRVLTNTANSFEIIVIDDGSVDQTLSILNGLLSSLSHLRILHNDLNSGLGFSIRKGFSAAQEELIFYTDADMPIDYMQIYKAVSLLNDAGADLVCGYRKNRGGEPFHRTVYSVIYNWLINKVFGLKVRDVNFSCKLFKRKLAQDLSLISKGSFIDAEAVVKTVYRGNKMIQFGLDYFHRNKGRSNLASPKVIIGILGEMFAQYRSIITLKRYGQKTYS